MKSRKVQSVLLATSGLLLAVPPSASAADVVVSGVVRDSRGVPQMDVLVELMRADSTVIQSVRTDAHGMYVIAGMLPGVYQLKAIETSFLPTLRENLLVSAKGKTQANLTLSTLMEALSWLPAHKKGATEAEDDWTWTLRSAAYRPLLRYVDADGLETIEPSEGPGRSIERNRGRLLIESGARRFGAGGTQETAEFEHQDRRGGQSLLRGEVSDLHAGPTTLMAGYSQQNAIGSGITTVVTYQGSPELANAGGRGFQQISFQTADTMRLLPDLMIEAGTQMQRMTLGAQQRTAAMPFANAAWAIGNNTISYSVATSPLLQSAANMGTDSSSANLAGEQNGLLREEHGFHQQIKIEHDGGAFSGSIAVYRDEINDPVIDAMGSPGVAGFNGGDDLYDSGTNIARFMGANYASRGVAALVRHDGPLMYEAIAFATGSALEAPHNPASAHDEVSLTGPSFEARNAESLSVMAGGKMPHAGTSWRAAYRLQPGNTVTAVDLFESGMANAYLSLFLRQPLHHSRIFPGGVDAVVNVNNLLAQGYHPFLTSDGSTLFFAQVNRSVQGGLAFYF